MNFLTQTFADAALFVKEHYFFITFATAVVTLTSTVVIFLLRKEALSAERWARYFGIAFGIFFLQYLLHFIIGYVEGYYPGENIHYTLLPAYIGSSINNVFFLAAALALLGYKKVFPTWAWVVAILALVAIFEGNYWWLRLPDALFSVICVSVLGYAMFTNISYRRHPVLASLPLAVASLYLLLELVYGFNPLIATHLWQHFAGALPEKLKALDLASRIVYLDHVIYTCLLPLKFCLFISAYILLMQAIVVISSSHIRKMLRPMVEGRLEYMSNEGIVHSICDNLKADSVCLDIKLPGLVRNRIATFVWNHHRSPGDVEEPRVERLDEAKEPITYFILTRGMPYEYPSRSENHTDEKFLLDIDGKSSVVAAPIIFHGGAIGSLRAELTSGVFSKTAVEHIKEMAVLVAPDVQSYRELAALDQFSYRFTRLQVDKPDCTIKQSVTAIGNIVSDILAPLAVGLFLDCGFNPLNEVISDDERSRKIILEEVPKHKDSQSAFTLETTDVGEFNVFKNRLAITPRERAPRNLYYLGELVVAVPVKRDDVGRPILGTNTLYLRAVGAQVSDALFDTAREFMNNLLNQFSIDLNKNEVNSITAWFKVVQDTAQAAGIKWVLGMHSGDDLMGEGPSVTTIQQLMEREPQWESPRNNDMPGLFARYDLEQPLGSANHVVRLHLNNATHLWLGIERSGFGFELEFNTPWAAFLHQFIDIANSALIRFTAAKDMERFQTEAFHYQGLATVAATTGTFIHQIGNCTTSISFTASSLLEAYKTKAFECAEYYGELIAAMCDSTAQLSKLTSSILNVTKVDDRRPCRLLDAAVQSKHLFDLALSQRNIKLDIQVRPDLLIDVPFYVAALAIACLVDNAKDILSEFRTDGVIKIEVGLEGDMVYCYVSDNGPGIRPDVKEKIFDIGVTTKPKSGGWGLYLIKRSLQENRSSIKVVDSDEHGTKFQIRFPKPRQE